MTAERVSARWIEKLTGKGECSMGDQAGSNEDPRAGK